MLIFLTSFSTRVTDPDFRASETLHRVASALEVSARRRGRGRGSAFLPTVTTESTARNTLDR